MKIVSSFYYLTKIQFEIIACSSRFLMLVKCWLSADISTTQFLPDEIRSSSQQTSLLSSTESLPFFLNDTSSSTFSRAVTFCSPYSCFTLGFSLFFPKWRSWQFIKANECEYTLIVSMSCWALKPLNCKCLCAIHWWVYIKRLETSESVCINGDSCWLWLNRTLQS